VKVILDTNVFVSGIFFSGPPYKILKAWSDDEIQLIVSPEILEEYQRVGEILAESHEGINLSPWIELVVQRATVFSTPQLAEGVCEDPAELFQSIHKLRNSQTCRADQTTQRTFGYLFVTRN